MYKRVISAIIILAVSLSIISCSKDSDYSHCEMVIPLDNGYREIKNQDFDKTYSNGEYVVAILRISFVAAVNEGIPETMTDVEFAEFWLEKCGREANVINDGVTYAEYYDGSPNSESFYLEAFYRSNYAYFVILFASDISAEEFARFEFLNYAEQVYFTE